MPYPTNPKKKYKITDLDGNILEYCRLLASAKKMVVILRKEYFDNRLKIEVVKDE